MPNYVPLSRSKHALKAWKRSESYEFASKQAVVPVVTLEIGMAAINMPLGFLKDGNNFHLAALLSVRKDTNLFIAPNGRWIGSYIPALFRSYPFRLVRKGGTEQMVMCVDDESDRICEEGGDETIFREDGKLSDSVAAVAEFLQKLEASRLATDIAVKALDEAGVIAPWEIKVKTSTGETPLVGFFRADESKLNALDSDAYLTLRKAGAIGIAYGQIISMNRLEIFARLLEYQERIKQLENRGISELPKFDDIFAADDNLVL